MIVPVTVISSMATRPILAELADAYHQSCGADVTVESVGGIDAARRIRLGEAFDVVVLAADALEKLAAEGFVVADSVRPFARSPTAVAVRSGMERPTTCDEPSIRRLVDQAQTIALSTGPSGVAVRALLAGWGVGTGKAKSIVQAAPGVPVARLIAQGEADVGFQQWSELLGERGIDIIGAVSETLLPMTTFSVGLCCNARSAVQAQALIEFLTSTAASPVKLHWGMEAIQQHR